MKFFLISMLLLQFLLNGTKAHLDGQTSLRVPLLTDSGDPTETTISCSPFSVEDETSELEYVKYVLDSEEEENSTIDWTAQPDKTSFEQCASYAAEQNAGMFYFDGETCETSDSVYERKDKDCNSTVVKMVYMQKDFQPAEVRCEVGSISYSEGDEWEVELDCGVQGRKKCSDGVITAERKYVRQNLDIYDPYVEGQDYNRITGGCLIKPQMTTGSIFTTNFQMNICEGISALPCDPPSESDSETFANEVKAFLNSSVMESVTFDVFLVDAQRTTIGSWVWANDIGNSAHFAYTEPTSDHNCVYLTGTSTGYEFEQANCRNQGQLAVCCMFKD